MTDHADPNAELSRLLDEIDGSRMPFGKFGPSNFPPRGVPLHDLPYEYLAYFARRGFPKGRLGELLNFIYLAKRDGADAIFNELRTRAGGRTNLRRRQRRRWEFEED